jgi:hypothetical protein
MAYGKNIGALWSGKEGGKSVYSGTLDVMGIPTRIEVFVNEKKKGRGPDYNIVSYGLDTRALDGGGRSADSAADSAADTNDAPF